MQGKRTSADQAGGSDTLAAPPDEGTHPEGGRRDGSDLEDGIPEFLKLTEEQRRAARERSVTQIPVRKLDKEEWQLRMEHAAQARANAIREKNARGLAKVKKDHAGQKYIRPKKDKNGFVVRPGKWVPATECEGNQTKGDERD